MSDITEPAEDGRHKESGRRSLEILRFRDKLNHLLARTGRQNQWLTDVLVTPDGRRPQPQVISNWKSTGRLPVDYLVSFRFVFGIDEATLLLDDFEAFRAAVDSRMMPGSGRFWKTMLEKGETGPNALSLTIDGALEPTQRLRNLAFHRAGPVAPPLLPTASFEDGVRFSVPTDRLATLADMTGALSLTFCCRDSLGWKTITPSRHHPGFEQDGDRWLFPGPARGPLYFHETVGNYRAVLVAVAATLPPAVEAALRAGNTVWGTDALASWLFAEKPRYLVLDRPFFVMAPRR